VRILSVGYSQAPVGLSNHYHDCHQILFIKEGEVEVTVGAEEYRMGSGFLLLLSRFEEHSIVVKSQVYRRYTLRISPEVLAGEDGSEGLSAVLVNRGPNFSHVMETGAERGNFEALFCRMAEEFDSKRPLCERMLDYLWRQLWVMLYRLMPSLFAAETDSGRALVGRIRQDMEQHYSETVSLSSLAARYHVSPSHLSHLFKSVTGYAPMEYLNACRLSAAKELLSGSGCAIRDVVDRCGYGDESNFSRMFREKTGMTPSAFRNKYRGR